MLYKDAADFPSITKLTQSAHAEFFFCHRKKLMMSLCRESEIIKSKYMALESRDCSGLSRTVAQCGERDLITLEGEPNKSAIKERDLVTAGGRPAARSSLKKMQLDVLSHQRYINRDYMTAQRSSLNFIF